MAPLDTFAVKLVTGTYYFRSYVFNYVLYSVELVEEGITLSQKRYSFLFKMDS